MKLLNQISWSESDLELFGSGLEKHRFEFGPDCWRLQRRHRPLDLSLRIVHTSSDLRVLVVLPYKLMDTSILMLYPHMLISYLYLVCFSFRCIIYLHSKIKREQIISSITGALNVIETKSIILLSIFFSKW